MEGASDVGASMPVGHASPYSLKFPTLSPPVCDGKMEYFFPPSVGCFRENYLYGSYEEGLNVKTSPWWVIYPTDDGDNIASVEENLKCSRL